MQGLPSYRTLPGGSCIAGGWAGGGGFLYGLPGLAAVRTLAVVTLTSLPLAPFRNP